MIALQKWWNDFFHSRAKSPGVLCGYLRLWFALLVLFDRLLLTVDFHWFFLSGIMPCKQHYVYGYEEHYLRDTGSNYPVPPSILCYIAGSVVSPDYSPYVFWCFHILGVIHALLLFLGIYPKVQLIGLHINMLAFHFHSDLMWDGEDIMFKLWNFLFLFLPLQQVTIFDRFHGLLSRRKFFAEDHRDWPMWPFRLFQLELCFLYLGAGYTKGSTETWSSGNALYQVRVSGEHCLFPLPIVLTIVLLYHRSFGPDHTHQRFFRWSRGTRFYLQSAWPPPSHDLVLSVRRVSLYFLYLASLYTKNNADSHRPVACGD